MKICKIVLASLVLLLAGMTSLDAQSLKVTGIVSGTEGPEAGVAVMVKGKPGTGTMTGEDGSYVITATRGDILLFSMIGYRDIEIKVQDRTSVNVHMEPDEEFLDEVVVVGYGSQRKEYLVGSVSQVTAKDIDKAPVTNLQNMLTGRLAGMTNIQTTGTPGEDQTRMLVRGITTFNGDSAPLCIVDGIERNFTYLNPSDIASVSVLKDAATASIYGVKGANGVIIVTTKSGATGRPRISYNGSATFTTNTAVPEFCNAEQYVYYHNKAMELDGQAPYWTEENLQKLEALGILGDVNHLAEIYKPFGFTHQHNISLNGGNERIRYYASLGLMDQDGILKMTDFARYNVRTNLDVNLADGLVFGLNLSGNFSNRNKPGYSFATGYDDQGSTRPAEFSPITQAYYAIPLLQSYAPDGIAVGFHNGTYTRTPLAALTESGNQNQKRYNVELSTKLEYDFRNIELLKGLKASVNFAYDYSNTLDRQLMTPFKLYGLEPTTMTLTPMVSMGISLISFNKSASWGWKMTIRPQLDYARTFGKHSISFTGLFESLRSYSDTMTATGRGYFTSSPMDISLAPDLSTPSSGSFDNYGRAGFAERLTYVYDGRYLAEVTLREDASYKFSNENRWGIFPSFALGWVLSKEEFLSGASSWLDFLKLKVSYGVLGDDSIDPYLWRTNYSSSSSRDNSFVIGSRAQSAFYSGGYVYPDLSWSHTQTFNTGFEGTFLDKKLTVEGDVYYKYTTNILEYDSIGTYSPSLGGFYPTWMNSGRMDNRGFELSIRHDNWFSNGLSYSMSGMVSWSRNRVLSRRITDNHPSYRPVLGEPLGAKYGFHALGFFQTDEEVASYPKAPSGYVEKGALMYEDINGDGIIDSRGDYIKIGRSSIPEMTFSYNLDVSWYNWTLSALLQGATLCDYNLSGAYNNTTDNTIFTRAFYGNGNSVLYLVEDAWTPDHTDAKYPRLSASTNALNAWASDWWIVDGSYLRIKNVQLSYNLSPELVRKAGISSAAIYLAGTNLLTLSHFKYLDPENPGVNNGYYPQQMTFSLGANITF